MRATNKKIVNYVSEIDQFIARFDHPTPYISLSQQQEIEKHQRIHQLRDNPNRMDEKINLDDF